MLQHFLSLSRRGTLCAVLFVTLQNLMRASMFRSKYSILFSISYDESLAGIIIRLTKKLRAILFLIIYSPNIDKSTNNKLSLKYIAQTLSGTTLLFNNATLQRVVIFSNHMLKYTPGYLRKRRNYSLYCALIN